MVEHSNNSIHVEAYGLARRRAECIGPEGHKLGHQVAPSRQGDVFGCMGVG